MNYIKRLEYERDECKQLVDELLNQRTELLAYLQSDKFYNDTTVQTVDVMRRLGAY